MHCVRTGRLNCLTTRVCVTGGGGQIQTQNKFLTIYLRSEESTWQRGEFLELVAETQHCTDTGETLIGRWLPQAALASYL